MDIPHFFSLSIEQKNESTSITMQVHGQHINTARIPSIVDLLQFYLPNVLRTQCFNDEGLPFEIEVKNTEMGHLFEHILLEYLCQLKIAKGYQSASFAGRTKWNWIKDPKGKFHISLNCGTKDKDILHPAISKTISLMKIVLQSNRYVSKNTESIHIARNGLKNGKRLRRNT